MQNKKEYIENAIRWAKTHLNSANYATLCLSFVEDAYEIPNKVEIDGTASAKESADKYGTSNDGGEPEVGAFVFYDCYGPIKGQNKNWGHVGLYLGNEQVIHAWDKVRIDPYMAVEKLKPAPGWRAPAYIGWPPFETIFIGHTCNN